MNRKRIPGLPAAVFLALAGLAPEAQAYLDPSTGSMILSAVVGLFATLGLAVKTYWYKLRNLLMRRPGAGRPQPDSGSAPDQAGPDSGAADTGRGNRPS